MKWKVKETPALSTQKEKAEEEYWDTPLGKVPVIRKLKGDPPISADKG